MSEAVARRYADALFEVAQEHGWLDELEKDLDTCAALFGEHEQLQMLFSHPRFSSSDKKQVLAAVLGEAVKKQTMNLLKLLIDRDRFDLLDEIREEYVRFANEARGIEDAVVTTAAPLDEKEIQTLAQELGEKLEKKLRLQTKVNPELIGGLHVKIGTRVYDGSIRGKLSRFVSQLEQSKVR